MLLPVKEETLWLVGRPFGAELKNPTLPVLNWEQSRILAARIEPPDSQIVPLGQYRYSRCR